MSGFIATAQINKEIVSFSGEGITPELALKDFMDSGEFNEHCLFVNAEDEQYVEIGVFKAIYKDSSEWDSEHFNSEFDWVLGDMVLTKTQQYLM